MMDPLPLGGALFAAPADAGEACAWARLYRGGMDEHDRSEAELLAEYEAAPSVWVLRQGARVGGAIAGPGVLSRPFAVPPQEGLGELVLRLTAYVRRASRAEEGVLARAPAVRMSELDDFYRAGWTPQPGPGDGLSWCRAMVRPTQSLPWPLPEGVSARSPRKADLPAYAQLLLEAYGGRDPQRVSRADFLQDALFQYERMDAPCKRASSLVEEGGRLMGACFVTLFVGAPVVWDVAVHPCARGRGLARAMLCRALSGLYPAHGSVRLFVEAGNPVQALYHTLGFYALPTTCDLILPA